MAQQRVPLHLPACDGHARCESGPLTVDNSRCLGCVCTAGLLYSDAPPAGKGLLAARLQRARDYGLISPCNGHLKPRSLPSCFWREPAARQVSHHRPSFRAVCMPQRMERPSMPACPILSALLSPRLLPSECEEHPSRPARHPCAPRHSTRAAPLPGTALVLQLHRAGCVVPHEQLQLCARAQRCAGVCIRCNWPLVCCQALPGRSAAHWKLKHVMRSGCPKLHCPATCEPCVPQTMARSCTAH